MSRLLDEDNIVKYRAIVDASVSIKYTPSLKQLTEDNLRTFLGQFSEEHDVNNREEVLKKLREIFLSDGWKLAATLKGSHSFQKKVEGSSILLTRCVVKVEAPMATVYASIRNFDVDKLVTKRTIITIPEMYNEDQCDMKFFLNMPFPMTNREFIITRYCHWDEKLPLVAMISTTREDCPIVKNVIRAEMHSTGYVLEPSSEKTCILTFLTHTNLKGKIPAWLVNMGASTALQQYTKFASTLEGRYSEESSEVEIIQEDIKVDQ